MKPHLFRLFLSFALLGVVATVAVAEVIELEGTIKAIDADARTVTIERKTPKGIKTLDLEVNKKAGDLSAVKVGDTISFSYDPDLEIVTKLGGSKSSGVAKKEDRKGVRFSVCISETGEVAVGLSNPSVDDAGEKESGVSRTKQDDGTWVQALRFKQPQSVEAFTFAKNVTADGDMLVLKPGKSDKGDYLSAGCAPKGRLRVPLCVEIDVEAMKGDAQLRLELNGGSAAYNGQQLFFLSSKDGLSSEAIIASSTGQGEKAESRFRETVKLGESWKHSFRLPIPNAKNSDVYGLVIGAFGNCEVRLRKITLRGQPVPLFGIGFDAQGPTVFAKMVAPNSLAKKAGIQEGDVIVSINGVAPSSMADALEKMTSVGFEKPCEIVVARGREKKAITMTAKWDD